MVERQTSGFDEFIGEVRRIVSGTSDPVAQASQVSEKLQGLLRSGKGWMEGRLQIPADQQVGEYELWRDPELGFLFLVHVLRPQHTSPVHNHGPHWVVYGVIENQILQQRYRRLDGGSREGYADLAAAGQDHQKEGNATFFSPLEAHSTSNPTDQRAVIVRITQVDLSRVRRHRFVPSEKQAIEFAGGR